MPFNDNKEVSVLKITVVRPCPFPGAGGGGVSRELQLFCDDWVGTTLWENSCISKSAYVPDGRFHGP